MWEQYHKECISVNQCPPRAYFIPFAKDDEKSYARKESSKFVDLNGEWWIEPYQSAYDAGEFWTKTCSKKISVPSCVQYYGLDGFQYTNINYPFPYEPPLVPEKNPCFHYTRNFTVDKADDERVYLVTEGVDSCFYLYVNGLFVGFSQISHKLGEFEITPYLQQGENKIDMLVMKWCKGSYLEDQDKWRFTGIFRDVYLLKRSKEHITDYKITTKIDGADGIVTFIPKDEFEIKVCFNGECKITKGQPIAFRVENAKLWTAETPTLYDMTLECNEEIIYERVGIRTSEVKDGIFLVNGQPIKLYGVNRHDFHAEKGAAVSEEDIKADLTLMKKLNVNAIRTSHYPSSPYLYQLCDEMGFYVMSESDLESHGAQTGWNYNKEPWKNAVSTIAENPIFRDAFLERQIFNIQNNKNHACIIIWSMGNECGFGKNFLNAIPAIRALDDRPLHYESFCHYPDCYTKEDYYAWDFDMVSRMYEDVTWIKDGYLADEQEKRPLVFCEYQHAMGNGPGGFKEYLELFESQNRIMGGFVWEWADHGVTYAGKTERYGGDFGEIVHDSNFCMDGIVTADRRVKAGTLQMKYFYQPLGFSLEEGELVVFNKNFFADEVGTLCVMQDGKEEKISALIAPRSTLKIAVEKGKTLLVRYFRVGEIEACAQEQFYFNAYLPTPFIKKSAKITQDGRFIQVNVGNTEYRLDRTSAEIVSVKVDGVEFGGLTLTLWRAPTDNDRNIRRAWEEQNVPHAYSNAICSIINEEEIRFKIGVGNGRTCYLLKGDLTYEFSENGVSVSIKYDTSQRSGVEYYAYLPRVGWKMKLPKTFHKLNYLAYGSEIGNGESYSDLYEYAVKAEYESDVTSQYFPYAKPQESGSHYAPEYAEITNGEVFIRAEGMRSFSALPYSAETLASVMHHDELPQSDGTYFTADYYMSGIGTNSCGPCVREPYRMPPQGEGTIRFFFGKVAKK